MSQLLLDSGDTGPAPDPIQMAVALDVAADVTAAASVVVAIPMVIAIDITDDITSSAFTPFIAPEPGCKRVAVITH